MTWEVLSQSFYKAEFIKVAGAGVLAVSCAGMLSGCDVVDSIKEELEDQGAAKATISNNQKVEQCLFCLPVGMYQECR